MSVNVKLGDNVINNVDNVKLKDASNDSVYHTFSISAGGSKAHRIFIGTDRDDATEAEFTAYVGSNNTTYEYSKTYDLLSVADVKLESNDYLELLATLVGTTKANIMALGTTIYVKISGRSSENQVATFVTSTGAWQQVFGDRNTPTLSFYIKRNTTGDVVYYANYSRFTIDESTLYWECYYNDMD